MKFKRVENFDIFVPGSYGKDIQGNWMICFLDGRLGNLKLHKVIENKDGTITVTPSILVRDGKNPDIHGFLEHGIWRDC